MLVGFFTDGVFNAGFFNTGVGAVAVVFFNAACGAFADAFVINWRRLFNSPSLSKT
jgi:hypothetical protein